MARLTAIRPASPAAWASPMWSPVRVARDHDVENAVRGGGHGWPPPRSVTTGVDIDLSAMRAVWVDPAGRTAWVQGGALWGDVDDETRAHGLASTGGIGGHTKTTPSTTTRTSSPADA